MIRGLIKALWGKFHWELRPLHMTDQRKPVEPQEPEIPLALPPLPKLITSDELFGEERQILIDHAGSVYRLQITKQGKLILTK